MFAEDSYPKIMKSGGSEGKGQAQELIELSRYKRLEKGKGAAVAGGGGGRQENLRPGKGLTLFAITRIRQTQGRVFGVSFGVPFGVSSSAHFRHCVGRGAIVFMGGNVSSTNFLCFPFFPLLP